MVLMVMLMVLMLMLIQEPGLSRAEMAANYCDTISDDDDDDDGDDGDGHFH